MLENQKRDDVAVRRQVSVHVFYVRDVIRRAAHTLSDSEEKILADAAPLAASPNNIYTILANADFPYPTITLADGKSVKVDQAGYSELRTSPNRTDRQAAMSAFFSALGSFGRTLGMTMNSNVQKALFYSRSRKYASNLEAALNGPNIPVTVYTRLVDGVNRHLPTFHRYLKLRKRMMGLTDDLHYYDLYAPLVASVDLRYTPEEAQENVIGAMAPLGKDYTDVLRKGFKERWIDWYPTEGKVAGAYSNGGAYDVHPYMLLNYLGQYNDVSTLAHELGHTMQSYYSNKTQPYATAGYPTFVAEVASTFNEALLIDYMTSLVAAASRPVTTPSPSDPWRTESPVESAMPGLGSIVDAVGDPYPLHDAGRRRSRSTSAGSSSRKRDARLYSRRPKSERAMVWVIVRRSMARVMPT